MNKLTASKMNPKVDDYLKKGCMRCTYGGTPKCKVLNWVEELTLLRQIALEAELKEEIKWGVPVYTYNGKNIITVNALKESANIGFFKGVLLSDVHKILQQQGNVQSGRLIKFYHVNEIKGKIVLVKSYIEEAIIIEKSGKKVASAVPSEPIPDELLTEFKVEPAFQEAFFSLTPGRQRGYLIYFSQPKQSQTRIGRIAKYKKQILRGKGMHDT